jgi:hypothetical protein
VHALVQNGDDADVAVGKPPPVNEMVHVPEEVTFHPKLGRHGPRHDAPRLDLFEGGEQPGNVGLGLCLALAVAGVAARHGAPMPPPGRIAIG